MECPIKKGMRPRLQQGRLYPGKASGSGPIFKRTKQWGEGEAGRNVVRVQKVGASRRIRTANHPITNPAFEIPLTHYISYLFALQRPTYKDQDTMTIAGENPLLYV